MNIKTQLHNMNLWLKTHFQTDEGIPFKELEAWQYIAMGFRGMPPQKMVQSIDVDLRWSVF